jgi:hypothetical protein
VHLRTERTEGIIELDRPDRERRRRQVDLVGVGGRPVGVELAQTWRDAQREGLGAKADVGFDERVGGIQEHLDLEHILLTEEERVPDVDALRPGADVAVDALPAEGSGKVWTARTDGASASAATIAIVEAASAMGRRAPRGMPQS